MKPSIHTEIGTLYEAFAEYPLATEIVGCPHCELDEAEAALHSKPLRELGWDDFSVYPFKAMTTFGGLGDFKHFLPRILELHIVDPDNARYGFEVFLCKLKYGEWANWPEQERTAILRCIEEWVRALKSMPWDDPYDPNPCDEVLEALKECGVEIAV